MIHMCQKCAANIGKTELTYKPPIDTPYANINSALSLVGGGADPFPL